MMKGKERNLIILLLSSMMLFYITIPPINTINLFESHQIEKSSQTQHYGIIMFDYAHGQYSELIAENMDSTLESVLEGTGYSITWQNDSFTFGDLENVDGLIIGSILGEENGFTEYEFAAIANWFNDGGKFMWIAGDADYEGYYINANMTAILESVGSHVYLEPTDVYDEQSNCGAPYRVVANETGSDDLILEAIVNVESVLLHGPTLLYGSTSSNPTEDIVPLELQTIEDVYPLLMFGSSAKIFDSDGILPIAHSNDETGSFVGVTLEVNAGLSTNSTLVVSGASPYGDYMPMFCSEYYNTSLTGDLFVFQTIHLGMQLAVAGHNSPPTITTDNSDTTSTTSTISNDSIPFSFSPPLIISLVSSTVILSCIVLIFRYQKK
jgi:hypothetical protein